MVTARQENNGPNSVWVFKNVVFLLDFGVGFEKYPSIFLFGRKKGEKSVNKPYIDFLDTVVEHMGRYLAPPLLVLWNHEISEPGGSKADRLGRRREPDTLCG